MPRRNARGLGRAGKRRESESLPSLPRSMGSVNHDENHRPEHDGNIFFVKVT